MLGEPYIIIFFILPQIYKIFTTYKDIFIIYLHFTQSLFVNHLNVHFRVLVELNVNTSSPSHRPYTVTNWKRKTVIKNQISVQMKSGTDKEPCVNSTIHFISSCPFSSFSLYRNFYRGPIIGSSARSVFERARFSPLRNSFIVLFKY